MKRIIGRFAEVRCAIAQIHEDIGEPGVAILKVIANEDRGTVTSKLLKNHEDLRQYSEKQIRESIGKILRLDCTTGPPHENG